MNELFPTLPPESVAVIQSVLGPATEIVSARIPFVDEQGRPVLIPVKENQLRIIAEAQAAPPVAGEVYGRKEDAGEYGEKIARQGHMGPLVVRDLGDGRAELIDGYHRFLAHRGNGDRDAPVAIVQCTRAQAIMLAARLNANRGIRFLAGEKQQVAQAYIRAWVVEHPGEKLLGDEAYAADLGFSRSTTKAAIETLVANFDVLPEQVATRQVQRGGKTFEQKRPASQASRSQRQPEPEPEEDEPEEADVLDLMLSDDDITVETGPAYRRTPERTPREERNGASRVGTATYHQPPPAAEAPVPSRPGDVSIVVLWTILDRNGDPVSGRESLTSLRDIRPEIREALLDALTMEQAV